MNENDISSLDTEFKRYLQIMRPYLGLLEDQDTIDVCNAWIQRLTKCKKKEKYLRNKYVFSLCFQLAQGVFEEPFTRFPTSDSLLPINDDDDESNSSSEVEYVVINADEESTKIIYDNKTNPESECFSQSLDYEENDKSNGSTMNNEMNISSNKTQDMPLLKQNSIYTCSNAIRNIPNNEVIEEDYKNRTYNLILKLREIKLQNEKLHAELEQLKENSKAKSECCGSDKYITRVDKPTSTCGQISARPSLIISLKSKLQEVQESRNVLIETIKHLQEKIDNLNEVKKHELSDIKATYHLELTNLRSEVEKELSETYEKKIEEQKQCFENKIKELQNVIELNKSNFVVQKEIIVTEKDKIINEKDVEIAQLKKLVDEQKANIHSILNKLSEKPKESNDNNDVLKLKAEQLEKRLCKMEKSKAKCIRMYEAKLANLQREKHLAECSLQLQLVRQRAQVISDVTDENQTELAATLDKLETKYKEIVANVQSTAIQRRVQDQMTLESLVQATMKSENVLPNGRSTNRSQFSVRNIQNQSRDENGFDTDISSLLRGNKVGNVVGGNKSFGEDSVMAGYCLDGERMGQLFERVYIPQRDTGDGPLKK